MNKEDCWMIAKGSAEPSMLECAAGHCTLVVTRCFAAPGGANKTMTGIGHTFCGTESALHVSPKESQHRKLERPSPGLILPLQSVAVSVGCHTREPLGKGSFSPSISALLSDQISDFSLYSWEALCSVIHWELPWAAMMPQ